MTLVIAATVAALLLPLRPSFVPRAAPPRCAAMTGAEFEEALAGMLSTAASDSMEAALDKYLPQVDDTFIPLLAGRVDAAEFMAGVEALVPVLATEKVRQAMEHKVLSSLGPAIFIAQELKLPDSLIKEARTVLETERLRKATEQKNINWLRSLLTLNCVALVAQLVDYYNMLFDRKRSEHRSSWNVPSTPGDDSAPSAFLAPKRRWLTLTMPYTNVP